MEQNAPDLAGIYITDEIIDVVLGRDADPALRKTSVGDLNLNVNQDLHIRRFFFSSYENIEDAFFFVCEWIHAFAPNLRSMAIGCYGPFESINPADRDREEYGKLQATFHGNLSNQNLITLIKDALDHHFTKYPLITVQTDVAAAAIGIAYNRSRSPNREVVKDQVVVFVKASLGIGGAFMRATTPWHGRLHSEMGQFHVPRWNSPRLDPHRVEQTWRYQGATNPDSIEALASVRAIEQRYAPLTFEQLRRDPTHSAWDREAWYLAQMCWAINCIVSPHRIVLGGRIISVPGLLDRVKRVYQDQIAGLQMTSSHAKVVAGGGNFLDAQLSHNKNGDLYAQKIGIIGSLCIAAMEDQPSSVRALPKR